MSARLAICLMPMSMRRVKSLFPVELKAASIATRAARVASAPNLSAAPVARTTRKRDGDSQDDNSAASTPRELRRIRTPIRRVNRVVASTSTRASIHFSCADREQNVPLGRDMDVRSRIRFPYLIATIHTFMQPVSVG